jgi:hypothetical protein
MANRKPETVLRYFAANISVGSGQQKAKKKNIQDGIKEHSFERTLHGDVVMITVKRSSILSIEFLTFSFYRPATKSSFTAIFISYHSLRDAHFKIP